MANWIKETGTTAARYARLNNIAFAGVVANFKADGTPDGTFNIAITSTTGDSMIVKTGFTTIALAQSSLDTDIANDGGAIVL